MNKAIEAFDFAAGATKARWMSDLELYFALLDIRETLPHSDALDRQEGGNRGGYYRDEASVYRAEIVKRRK